MISSNKDINIGRHFFIGLSSTNLTEEEKVILSKLKPLGIIFFSRNFISDVSENSWTESFQKLKNDIIQITEGSTKFFSIDFEGGRVNRFPINSSPRFPYARQWSGDSFRISYKMSSYLKNLGINLNFSPVLDLDLEVSNPVIGQRSFSNNPYIVELSAREFIRASTECGVLSCLKHFPGHGRTKNDSHFELPKLDISREELNLDIHPFKKLIEENIVSFIMTAHIIYTQIDDIYPASISKKIITTMLRQELNYQGIIISDDFDMKALSYLNIINRAELMIKAGTDILLIGNGMSSNSAVQAFEIFEYIKTNLNKDKLLKDSILKSQERLELEVEKSLSRINYSPSTRSILFAKSLGLNGFDIK